MKITKIIKTVMLKYSKEYSNIPIKEVDLFTSLPENLHFILIGIMLGDGSLYRFSSTSNSRF